MANAISNNLDAVRERIARAAREQGRSPESVTLIAVSKTKPAAAIAEAHRAGHRDFGENYPRKPPRSKRLAPAAAWHFIGRF